MKCFIYSLSLILLLCVSAQARFTEYKERHLGPTGMFGVTSPTEIKITKISKGSPAEGKVKEGDVIVNNPLSPPCMMLSTSSLKKQIPSS
jgi:hypothetical protein